METSYSTQSLHGAPPWSPHHLQQPREGRTVKEGGVFATFPQFASRISLQTLEADRAVWNSSLLKRAPPNMRLRQKKLSLDLIWCEKYSL
jgi:hypothetical protein